MLAEKYYYDQRHLPPAIAHYLVGLGRRLLEAARLVWPERPAAEPPDPWPYTVRIAREFDVPDHAEHEARWEAPGGALMALRYAEHPYAGPHYGAWYYVHGGKRREHIALALPGSAADAARDGLTLSAMLLSDAEIARLKAWADAQA